MGQHAGCPSPVACAIVPNTAIVPGPETPKRPGVPTTPQGSVPSAATGDEAPATFRLPVAVDALPSPAARQLATTPLPMALSHSASEWNSRNTFDVGGSHRHPRIGETILGFKLIGELGRGAFARVYLAEQESLAHRQVALKITHRPTREAERLARLQHTNIVPIYSIHDADGTQVICMPYLGRITIADLIRAYRTDPPAFSGGRKSTSARAARTTSLESKTLSSKVSTTDSKGRSTVLPIWTWDSAEPPPIIGDPIATLQVLAQLAAGLSHAHQRGILHLDIKPANVLLADTGEPMLLDFNLSFDTANPQRDHVGGTMPYMAIEQLIDMRSRGQAVIDERTDLYGLGVMAYEMLTGEVPFPTSTNSIRNIDPMIALRKKGPPSIRQRNPWVTPAVEAIVRKLLAPEPGQRYQSAEELRIDIERHLENLPLKYAREVSLRERFSKWRRRNPRLPLQFVALGTIALALGSGVTAINYAADNTRHEATQKAHQTQAALDTIRLDLTLLHNTPTRERGIQNASELLAAYGLPEDRNWRQRPAIRALPDAEQRELVGHLGELMLLLAQAKWQQAQGRGETERATLFAKAWQLNAAAQECFDAGIRPAVLDQQALLLAPLVGERFQATPEELATSDDPRSRFLEAVLLIHQARYASAIPLLERVIAQQPQHAAAQFSLAFCRQQLGQYDRAIERYDVASTLLPHDPRPAYQRGIIYAQTRKSALAEAEFTKAIAIDPDFADAYLRRASEQYRLALSASAPRGDDERTQNLLRAADADLTRALDLGAPATLVRFIRAKVRDKLGDSAGATADTTAIQNVVPQTEEEFLARGWYRMGDNPQAAIADFQKALERNPRSLPAFMNLAHLHADRLNDTAAAKPITTRLVQLYPDLALGHANHAVVLARLGEVDAAHQAIQRALTLSNDPDILYQAASVYALSARHHPEFRAKALEYLRNAVRNGYTNLESLRHHPDWQSMRDTPEFQEIRRAAQVLIR